MKSKIQATIAAAMLIAVPSAFGATAEVYTKHCAMCHGADGKGKKAMKTVDYTTAEGQKWSDADGIKAIMEGKGKMKAFKGKVTDAEAKELVAYIRAFKK